MYRIYIDLIRVKLGDDDFVYAVRLKDKGRSVKSWGFCSRDCYLDSAKEGDTNVLRWVNNVDVLDDKLCNLFLHNSSCCDHVCGLLVGFIYNHRYTSSKSG